MRTHLPARLQESIPKSRAKRGCASKLACGRRIDPAEQSVFSVNPGEFVIFFWADRVVGPYEPFLTPGPL